MALPQVTLEDKYARASGRILISGTQALVRLPLMQRARDVAAGLNTAGYISGYRGSPLGGYDQQLWQAARHLAQSHVVFVPGVNEDLAATAVWGTQQVSLLGGARYDGVFAIWYGKGPGVDRSGDPIKHGNRMGTSRHGGVLVVFGDDHPAKSSTVAHQSEQALAAHGVPVLYPATVQEYLDFGLLGFALSRFAGVWVGFKCVNETVETTATAEVDPLRPEIATPRDVELPADGVHARIGFDPLGDEVRLARYRLPLAQAFARANGVDRRVLEPRDRRLLVVAAGKSYLDVEQALAILGIDAARAQALGVGLYKPGLIWPLDPKGLLEAARGYAEIFVVEEKAAFLEPQIAHALFNVDGRPRLGGKCDPQGTPLLPSDVPLEPVDIARVLAGRLIAGGGGDAGLTNRLTLLDARLAVSNVERAPVVRTPYFCAGCPHNTSTQVPVGSLAFSGIGCHTMAMGMNRRTLPPTQMGGEGLTWTGIAPFSSIPHVFQNLGDGTYFHSGLLAVRAAVHAGVNITYKILVNDAVAMTGGQPVEGRLGIEEITRQLAAERVGRIAVVSDEPEKYARGAFAPSVTVHHRDELARLQREFREVSGVSAIVYDQTCAAEKRRRRKRRAWPDPPKRAFINERVCEGCGDCSVKSNCVAVEPVETDFGRKRRIDQATCNKDYSCVRGFCPSFVVVRGGALRARAAEGFDESLLARLPEPPVAPIEGSYGVLVTGIGGTGVVTVGAILAMAAHLEGRAASVFDMTGLAQKGGAVLSHLKIAREPGRLGAPRIGFEEAALVIGCDLLVTADAEALRSIAPGRTRVVVNTHLVPTGRAQLDPDVDFRPAELLARIERTAEARGVARLDATRLASELLGEALGANLISVGHALQAGLLPIGREALEQAIRLNGVAVELNLRALALGRLAAARPEALAAAVTPRDQEAESNGETRLDALVARRTQFLTDYQSSAYAERYRQLVEKVRRIESSRVPGSEALALAVARYYAKLLAYKDEYEVARLYSDGVFRASLDAQFRGPERVSVLLAPPWLARRDPSTGEPRKIEFGPWIFRLFRVLAKLRVLRGGPFDPFGRSAERRTERRLIAEYEALVDELLGALAPGNHPLAVELASLPERIRGFGHVKARHLAEADRCRAELLARFRGRRDERPAAA